MTLLDTSMVPHGRTLFEEVDHGGEPRPALWFHRPFQPTAGCLRAGQPQHVGRRGFSRGRFSLATGRWCGSVAQEGWCKRGQGS
jgi:acyl-CoA thioesterase-2